MTELPRKAAARTARLAALPLGYAGRQAMGLGKRLGGRPADAVLTEVQQRTAEQLFRTLGELKGGAMKFGQALSVLESALPEDVAAPYREHLTALQDSAPPMPTSTVREQLTTHLGADWPERLVWLDGAPTAAASIGQVHRGRWRDHVGDGAERDVAVKVQYPGAGEALMSDLRQIARVARGVAPVFPGIDIKPLVAELQDRAADELDYHLEAEAQAAYAEAFADHPHIVVPAVVAVGGEVLVTEWMDSAHSLAHVIREGTQEERDHYGELFVRFLFEGPRLTGMLHADPHPGNFRVLPAPDGGLGRLGVLDFGAVARLSQGQLPEAMGRLIRIALESDEESLVAGLREEGFIKDRIEVDPAMVLTYLAPFVEPAAQERFAFTREWMREQFERINDPRAESFTLATKLNLPTSYLLIHRTWLGALGLLSQLGASAPFREILEESLPGFADE
ncbi:ABC1 kinase family protein [Nocardioides ganghwensis]|uniref:AarF/ABC1/UbiB kinase family protein n=1 Tax=Nocardioides ganghwensis TaxID=252230 RepID=A0A4Q2SCG4_9ACTN|nr:AarF/UbiB family protein [Nocardioides ganghwensis]MBD3944244.1 AarF/ABC1/UbiB kinase family protein [Nocardioides ganghwensis]RYC00021.1 AarF/ABC1/UbiB kinase family protein [Nocardioides ganghwensis]